MRSASSDRTTVAFSVSPSHNPTGTFVPSAVTANATTQQWSAADPVAHQHGGVELAQVAGHQLLEFAGESA